MTLSSMNPVKTYEYLTKARERIFAAVRPMTDEQWRREFPIGPGSLAKVLTHIMICEQFYIWRMTEQVVPPYEQWPIQDEKPPAFSVIETEWVAQAVRTRATIAAIGDWDRTIEYRSDWEGVDSIITVTPTDIFTQLAMHEVHHRAQAMNMIRHLGGPVEDLDYNTLTYRHRPA